MNYGDERLPARFWKKVRIEDSGCWRWLAGLNGKGYGSFLRDSGIRGPGRITSSHRLAYETLVGPIPEGLQLDHLCRNRACCNPAHLEPVTSRENTRRGFALRTSCVNGHDWSDPANVYVHPVHGRRACRVCNSRLSLKRYHARRQAALKGR